MEPRLGNRYGYLNQGIGGLRKMAASGAVKEVIKMHFPKKENACIRLSDSYDGRRRSKRLVVAGALQGAAGLLKDDILFCFDSAGWQQVKLALDQSGVHLL